MGVKISRYSFEGPDECVNALIRGIEESGAAMVANYVTPHGDDVSVYWFDGATVCIETSDNKSGRLITADNLKSLVGLMGLKELGIKLTRESKRKK